MLFHIEHVHSEANCPYNKEDEIAHTFGKVIPGFKGAGARVVGAYTDPPSHTMFFIVDVDDWGQLRAGMEPIIEIGTATITPVTEYAPLVSERERV